MKEERKRMWVQTDGKFEQNEIKTSTKKYNIQMFSTRLPGGKAFAAKQKIRELVLNKVLDKRLKERIKLKKFLAKAKNNMNSVRSKKYGLVPKETEARSLANDVFRIKYNIYCLKKIKTDAGRHSIFNDNYEIK